MKCNYFARNLGAPLRMSMWLCDSIHCRAATVHATNPQLAFRRCPAAACPVDQPVPTLINLLIRLRRETRRRKAEIGPTQSRSVHGGALPRSWAHEVPTPAVGHGGPKGGPASDRIGSPSAQHQQRRRLGARRVHSARRGAVHQRGSFLRACARVWPVASARRAPAGVCAVTRFRFWLARSRVCEPAAAHKAGHAFSVADHEPGAHPLFWIDQVISAGRAVGSRNSLARSCGSSRLRHGCSAQAIRSWPLCIPPKPVLQVDRGMSGVSGCQFLLGCGRYSVYAGRRPAHWVDWSKCLRRDTHRRH